MLCLSLSGAAGIKLCPDARLEVWAGAYRMFLAITLTNVHRHTQVESSVFKGIL